MDNIANKTFKDKSTGNVVRVIDSFENIAILADKSKIDVRRLMDTNYYTEQIDFPIRESVNTNSLYDDQIDPKNFFSNQGSYNHLADKIKNLSTENMIDDDGGGGVVRVNVGGGSSGAYSPTTNESAVVMTTEEDERAELARKYGVSVDNTSSTNKQNAAFAKLLGEEGSTELPTNTQSRNRPVEVVNESVQRVEASRDVQKVNTQQHIQPKSEDPIITMFRSVKKGVDFKMNIEISNKIPRADFIEMMEDSYEVSLIDFLADEFTKTLLSNPQHIKDMIIDRIKQIVYSGEVKKKVVEKSVVVESKKKEYKKKATKPKSMRKDDLDVIPENVPEKINVVVKKNQDLKKVKLVPELKEAEKLEKTK